MSTFFRLGEISKKQQSGNDTEQPRSISDAVIAYEEGLIDKYRQDHAAILSIFQDILLTVQQADSKNLLEKLHDLQIALRRHLLDEEINLYIYLRHLYKQDKEKQELINKFKRCSKRTGQQVFDFIKKLSEQGYSIDYSDVFYNELLETGNLLEEMFDSELKQLYPIYRAKY